MKKETLINIIINDLKEVQHLMDSFRGETLVNSAFVNLAKTKIRNIEEEISLLNQEFGEVAINPLQVEDKRPVIIPEAKEATVMSGVDEVKTAESSKRFFSEEAGGLDKNEEVKSVPQQEVIETQEVKKEIITKKEKHKEPEKKIEHLGKRDKPEDKRRKPADSSATLADVLQKEKNAINEKVSIKKTENDLLFTKPVDDVRKAMGINDRFYYQRELFGGNSDLFNQTLDQLNRMSNFDDANKFLVSNFDWDTESEVSSSFFKIVKRRFL